MTPETKDLIFAVAGFVVPALLSPLAIMGLRPLFTLFLREGLDLFTDVTLEPELSSGIGRVMSKANVIVLVAAWMVAHGCHVLDGSVTTSSLFALAGVVGALLITVRMVRSRVGVVGQPGMLVGLLTFAGGNLPLFLCVPVILLVG